MEEIVEQILKCENINYNQIKKASSGFTSLVYFIDDKYVIKLSNDDLKKKKIEKEISIYKNLNFDFIPKYIASGNFKDWDYLIISKLEGQSVYSIWDKIDDATRENIVRQVAEILSKFHKVDGSFLPEEDKDLDWKNKIIGGLQEKIERLKNFDIDTAKLKNYIANASSLFDNNTYGLCYNDAHFDNFIFNNGKLYLIDFDRTRYCPIDYEMMIFKTMCDNPSKFASDEDEDKVTTENFANVYTWFKRYYPSLFATPNIEKRIKLYQYDYLINQAIKCKDVDWIKEENKNLLNK